MMAATDPNQDHQIPEWIIDEAERLCRPPEPGDLVLCKSETPPLDRLQRWRQDAIRFGFDPDQTVHLCFDGQQFGVAIDGDLVDHSLDEVF